MIPPDKMCPFSRVPTANESELAMQSNEQVTLLAQIAQEEREKVDEVK